MHDEDLLATDKEKNLFVTDRSVNGGGGNQNRCFFLKRQKAAECSKPENMQKYLVKFLQGYPSKTPAIFIPVFFFRTKVFFFHEKTYVLDHSASFDMHIENLKKNLKTRKIGFCRTGGGAQNVTDWSVTNRVFYVFPKGVNKVSKRMKMQNLIFSWWVGILYFQLYFDGSIRVFIY